MGIHGIYKEIGPGSRIALAALAVNHFKSKAKPLRLAIDTSIWLFQIQSSKGGTNPALRTFYYRLLRMVALNIHPLFVFDGPNKPPFKRNKRTGPTVASIPEFLAKQLLKRFSFPVHMAPGEAEAECALLQREGIVDAVLSEDVDTLMFGSKLTIRNWSAKKTTGASPTHVNVYYADQTRASSGLDCEGMVLVALMSGGDYVPEGIPGCGPKIACEAARAGFGHDLWKIPRSDQNALQAWRSRLYHELETNESKYFKSKHPNLATKIPDNFPNWEILRYYTHPAISSLASIQKLHETLVWDQPLNFPELRTFTAECFDWRNVTGAAKFVRNLAQTLLLRELRRCKNSNYVKQIHQERKHASVDHIPELRVSYVPIEVVDIDLSIEPPDDTFQLPPEEEEDDDEQIVAEDEVFLGPTQTAKSRPYLYDPSQVERIWIPEVFVQNGAAEKYAEWTALIAKKKATAASTAASKATARRGQKAKVISANQKSLDSFVSVSKLIPIDSAIDKYSHQPPKNSSQSNRSPPQPPSLSRPSTPTAGSCPITISAPSTPTSSRKLNGQITRRRKRSPLKRANTHASDMSIDQFFLPSKSTPATGINSLENTPKRPKAVSLIPNNSNVGTAREIRSLDLTMESPPLPKRALMRTRSIPLANTRTATKDCVDLTSSSPPRPLPVLKPSSSTSNLPAIGLSERRWITMHKDAPGVFYSAENTPQKTDKISAINVSELIVLDLR